MPHHLPAPHIVTRIFAGIFALMGIVAVGLLYVTRCRAAEEQATHAYETHPYRSVSGRTPFISNDCGKWPAGFMVRYALKY